MKNKMIIVTALLATGFTALLMATPMNGGGHGNCANGVERGRLGMHGAQGMMQKREMYKEVMGQGWRGKHRRADMQHLGKNNPLKLFRTIRKELNITTQQQQKIRDIMIDQRIKRLEIKKKNPLEKKEEIRFDMSKFISKDKFDSQALKKYLDEKATNRMQKNQARRTERLDMMTDTMQKVFNVLTPEQREKLVKLSQKEKK